MRLLNHIIPAALVACTLILACKKEDHEQTKPEPAVVQDGSAEHPYLITDKNQLLALHDSVATGKKLFFKLAADINLGGEAWTPLSAEGGVKIDLDGDGHSISNCSISSSGEPAGFFSILNGQVRNLSLKDIAVTTTISKVGVLAGEVSGDEVQVIDNVSVISCSASGKDIVGGLIGNMGGTAASICTGCSVSGTTVTGTYRRIGGLAGWHQSGTISRCAVEEDVTASTPSYDVGGITGLQNGTAKLENSYARANTSGSDNIAGLIGRLLDSGSVSNCYATGTPTTNGYKGGLIGLAGSGTSIKGCISWNSDLAIIGSNSATVSGCYAKVASETGNVSSHAQESPRNWSAAIWNFSGDFPTLRKEYVPGDGSSSLQHPALNIIPFPKKLTLREGTFNIYGAAFNYDPDLDGGRTHADDFGRDLGLARQESSEEKPGFNFLKDDSLGEEAYTIDITDTRVVVKASGAPGVIYAIQTLKQLMPTELPPYSVESDWTLPCLRIEDEPRFKYRGMHLDISRHFFREDIIRKYIDIMALYKMNRLHLHLTDDQGWRIEIKAYPKLTETGSVRNGTMVDRDFDSNDGITYGPYYLSQDDLQVILGYADQHAITIVPEIDLPGHMTAALASYHDLGCDEHKDYQVMTKWGISPDALCLGKESTWDFLHGVLREIALLFPSNYIHIGGDEIPSNVSWGSCRNCQDFIQSLNFPVVNGVSTNKQLQYYVAREIQEYLIYKYRKRVICWQETFDGLGPDDGSASIIPEFTYGDFAGLDGAIMSWTSAAVGIKAAKAGVNTIMAPSWGCYFDCRQSEADNGFISSTSNGNRPVTVADTYSLNPTASIPEDKQQYVLGAEGAMWTEYIKDEFHLFYMLLPRLAALSEVCWTPLENKDIERLKKALEQKHFKIYEDYGYGFRRDLDF